MPSIKKNWENLLKYASKNPKNRKEAVNAACGLIAILTLLEDKKLSKKDLEKIVGSLKYSDYRNPQSQGKKLKQNIPERHHIESLQDAIEQLQELDQWNSLNY